MRIAEINMVSNGSTGDIMLNLSKLISRKGGIARTFSSYIYSRKYYKLPEPPENHQYFGSYIENAVHTVLGQFTGLNGWFSYLGTLKLIKECKKYRPDIIHLHNLHAFCINLPLLLKYIKENQIPVVWTLHDCWTFTGKCPYFTIIKCEKWRKGCGGCPQLNVYPRARVDNTRRVYKLKKKWFTRIENMTIVTPSQWLADLVKESFLKDYPVKVINNGIDLSIFKPVESNFREKYMIENDKHILLGVALGWSRRKGFDVFVELSKRLDKRFQIILVGTDDNVDKQLSDNIISIHRTQNQLELAEIYTTADLFVNPTREEVFGLVNIEALACGTPVLTFRTGGSPECIDETCGAVVDCDDIDALESEIIRICESKPYTQGSCLKKSREFDVNDRFEEYIKLYEQITS